MRPTLPVPRDFALLTGRCAHLSGVLALTVVTGLAGCGPARPAVTPSPPRPMHSLVPLPTSVEIAAGEAFTITPTTAIVIAPGDPGIERVAAHLARLLAVVSGSPPPIQTATGPAPEGSIYLATEPRGAAGPEAYELTIAARGVTVVAGGPAGLFYGVQTLRQLLPYPIEHRAVRPRNYPLPAARIVDAPRFAWRGAMLDVSRHFFGVEDVKRYIDLLALLKLNRLHLHLSDDQGWRIEIKAWPNLTTHGGSTDVGGGPGGFYTQGDYAEIVSYAEDRFVMIVPEIDMPGHTNAALASYAELNCDGVAPPLYTGIEVGFSTLCIDKPVTYTFIDDVVREISALTRGPYFHIGGDEVEKLTPEEYARFIERVQDIVRSHGKEMIGWDEIMPVKLLPTSIVQHWRPDGSVRAAVEKKVRIILSPANRVYLDMKYDRDTAIGLDWAGLVEVRDAYDWDPGTLPDGVPESAILGVEAPLWSETLATRTDIEFMAFPRLAAVAEIGWTAADRRGWDDFRVRLGAQAQRWAALGINFYRSPQVPWRH